MYTVLLTDDDEGILTNLQNTIDWPVYGIETILTARDGLEAYALFDEHHIDLLITDISMPGMDGLELFRKIRESGRETRCILLSSYEDFDYAKEAINLGVENYLMKPVNTEELENTIRRALDNITLHRQAKRSIFLDNILYRWVTATISPEELSDRAKHIGLNTYFLSYCVVLMENSDKGEGDPYIRSVLYQLQASYEVYHFLHNDGYHVIILGGHSMRQSDITAVIRKALDAKPSASPPAASVGVVVSGTDDVPTSYKSALEYLLLSPVLQQVNAAQKDIALDLTEYQMNLILDYLSSEDEDTDPRYLFNTIFSGCSSISQETINTLSGVLSVRLALTLEAEGLIGAEGKESIICNTYHFEDDASGDELLLWFSNLLSVCRILIKEYTHCLSPVVLSAMDYIRKKYASHVSIRDFCNKYHANASYIGYLFRKETGIYFNDYINQIRISQSIQILKNTTIKISEVATMCGFNNTSYYILCFKKQTGISPAKFRQLLRKSDSNEPA